MEKKEKKRINSKYLTNANDQKLKCFQVHDSDAYCLVRKGRG